MKMLELPSCAAVDVMPRSDLDELALNGRVAIVSGSASGIGKATARLLGNRHATVVLFDKNETALSATTTEFLHDGIKCVALSGSATDSSDCDAVAQHCMKKFDRIDILVNNVGGSVIPTKPLWEVSDTEWLLMMDLNLSSAFKMCRSVIPHMLEARRGRILNVASTAGKEGNPNTGSYCTAKAAVIGMTKSLGKELATSGVLVNAVAPAVVETEATRLSDADPSRKAHMDSLRAKIPMSRMAKPEEIARLIGFLVSDHLSFSTGAVYDISGGRATY